MSKKFLDWQYDLLVLSGILFAIRLIYTKEIFIQVNGFTVNTLVLLIHIIILVGIYRSMGTETSSNNKEFLKNKADVEEK